MIEESTPPPVPGRLRLRPGVAVTPLRAGLHLRGRGTALTLEGSRALPALWDLLSDRLGTEPAGGQGRPADPRVESALATLTARLREHDLLVEHPDGVPLPAWPGSVADRPGEAAEAIGASRPVLAAAHPEGLLARALVRALTAAGADPCVSTDAELPAGRVVVVAGTPPVAVAVACDADGGFVTAPSDLVRARLDAAAISPRLAAPGTTDHSGPAPAPSRALTALLAGAAAQRLLCAVAGLPDPAEHDEDPRLLPGRPAVLVAEARPLHADYHPWVVGPPLPGAAPPTDLASALRRVAALGDPRLGVLDAPLPGALPQLPTAMVSCRTPAGTLVAGAVRTDLARLEAACRSAELHLAAGLFTPVVGVDDGHALGRALRRAALGRPAGGVAPPEDAWRDHPQARHWWTTLTRYLGREVDLTIRQFGSEQAFLAVVRVPAARGGAAPIVARAVESTPADAVAFAGITALARATAADHGLAAARHTAPSGAIAPLAAAGTAPAGWTDDGWTDRWLDGLAHREPALRAALLRVTGLRIGPWRPAGPSAPPVAAALQACGFTVLAVPGDPR